MRKWIFITYLAIFEPLGLYSISTDNNYSFSYIIDSEGILSQHTEESRNDVISGYYSFLQPDGIIRVVHYRAEPGRGFRVYIAFRKIPHVLKALLKFPRDFQHPIRLSQPLSTIPRKLLGT
ncbi:cuticle protein 18.6-like [Euwallacea similis]|uniref:cuticle protein 18.6-like n=1 Tax=Euwallacea similis TaxID=1736056 RepID=UPI00344C74D8